MSVTQIRSRNANDGFLNTMYHLRLCGVRTGTRNGPAVMSPGPVTVELLYPTQRVMWARRINPFLHFMEAMWMLAGRNDVDFVAQYTPRMRNYSDDGKTLHGAYGRRWFKHFSVDQVWEVILRLRRDLYDRRVVISMWDPKADLNPGPYTERKDLPCNTQIMFAIRNDKLDMTVINRSNDIVWGAFGTNSVHFTFLQEVIACAVGVDVGHYYLFSNNFHMYNSVEGFERFLGMGYVEDHYRGGKVSTMPLGLTPSGAILFLEELKCVLNDIDAPTESNYINFVVKPVMYSWLDEEVHPALAGTDWGLSIENYFRRKTWQTGS